MRDVPRGNSGLDPGAVEARTQAIGHALFADTKRAHTHLSILNRWTSRVLSWCLTDPAVKAAVLRFIDVLPSLRAPRDVARHVREYFPTQALRLPAALRLGSEIARPGLLGQGAVAAIVMQLVEQVARQFIARSTPEGIETVIRGLAARGATCSVDVLGEQVVSESEADRYITHCQALLEAMATVYGSSSPGPCVASGGPRANVSVKPSALSPRFDPISPQQSLERAMRRLRPLAEQVAAHDALLNLDMEQVELRDLTLRLAQQLCAQWPGQGRGGLGIVLQAYLRDAAAVAEELLRWLATHDATLTVRLVKGAYWDHEVALARRNHWPVPVYEHKAETDRAFERITEQLLSAFPRVSTAIASHNVRSIAHAMAVGELLGLAPSQIEFQLLYGMGEALQDAIVSRGYPVRIYTPVGALIPGMAYLVRRILENTSNESFLRQDLFQERSVEELLSPPRSTPGDRPGSSAVPAPAWRGEPLADFSRVQVQGAMAQALQSVRSAGAGRYPILLGEERVESADTLTVRNPANPHEVLGAVSLASVDQVDRAVRLATAAQPHWGARPATERVACLRRAAQLLRERRHTLAAWTVLEVGKTWREADIELVEAIEYLDYYGEQWMTLSRGAALRQPPGERNDYRYLPRGVAAVIAPWNFPVAILTGMAGAALVSGNAVILKPAEQASILAAHVVEVLREAGIPPGIVQYLPGLGEQIGAALVRHPGVQAILFTGSKAVGLSIIEAAARVLPGQRFIKHVVAEMGGKNAIIIDDDADLDAAVAGCVHSAMSYAGQKCSAASRLIVHQAVYDRFVPRFIAAIDRLVLADPADPGTDVGPLIDPSAQQRLHDAIAHAQEVASILYRYPRSRMPSQGHFVTPVVVTDVPPEDWLVRAELFGPLVCVGRAKTFADALTLANETEYALTGGVYSRSPSHLEEATRRFDVGNLYLNRPITGAMVGRQPFGGHRLSGLGTKAGGPDYLLQLVTPKTIAMNTTRHGTPLE